MKKSRFLVLFLIFSLVSILAGYGYTVANEAINDPDDLIYVKGEFDYYQTKRKWKNRRKGDTPFKKYLIIYLEDDLVRYKDGKYVLENMEQNAVLMIYNQWPKDSIEIGYKETDDSGLRIMYDIKYHGESLVDLDGIKASANKEASILLIFSIVGGVLSVLSIVKHLSDRKKESK